MVLQEYIICIKLVLIFIIIEAIKKIINVDGYYKSLQSYNHNMATDYLGLFIL